MLLRARAVTFTCYEEVARFVGLDPAEMIKRAGLQPGDLKDPENWLPAAKVLCLIEDSAARSGRDDFGILLGKCRSFTSLGPLSLLLKHEATIGKIMSAIADYSYLLSDLLQICVRDDGNTATIEWNLVPGLTSRHGASLIAAITYRIIAETLEFAWDPDCVHFRDATPEAVATFRRYFRCDLEFDSDFDGMSCSSAALQTSNPFAEPKLAAYARRLLSLLPGAGQVDATGKTRSTILLMLDDGDISLARAAECLGLTDRTLQRRLAMENTTFGRICNDVRRDLAMRYVANSSRSFSAVAGLLGYSGISPFSRWFAAEFGMTAAAYRRSKRAQLHFEITQPPSGPKANEIAWN